MTNFKVHTQTSFFSLVLDTYRQHPGQEEGLAEANGSRGGCGGSGGSGRFAGSPCPGVDLHRVVLIVTHQRPVAVRVCLHRAQDGLRLQTQACPVTAAAAAAAEEFTQLLHSDTQQNAKQKSYCDLRK